MHHTHTMFLTFFKILLDKVDMYKGQCNAEALRLQEFMVRPKPGAGMLVTRGASAKPSGSLSADA